MHQEFDVIDDILWKNYASVNTQLTAVLAMFCIPPRWICILYVFFIFIELSWK